MKNILLFVLLLVFTGCADDTIEDHVSKSTAPDAPKKKEVNSTNAGNLVNGLPYNPDSTHREAIIKFNEIKIIEIGNLMLENILKKNKKLEFQNDIQEAYGYFFTQDVWDSLAALGFPKNEVSMGEESAPIMLEGKPPYIDKGIWEEQKFNNNDMRSKHPILFKRAVDRFMSSEHPKINDVTMENQGGSFVDYSLKVSYNISNDQYIYYTVSNTNQRIVVTVDKFGMK